MANTVKNPRLKQSLNAVHKTRRNTHFGFCRPGEQAAGRCQRQWERSVSRLVGLLEPLLILVVGALVFLLALSVILPILSMNKALH